MHKSKSLLELSGVDCVVGLKEAFVIFSRDKIY